MNYFLLSVSRLLVMMTIVSTQSCFYKSQVSIPKRQDYIEPMTSAGFVLSSIYSYDSGWHISASAQYRINRKSNSILRYDLLTAEDWHLKIYDTLSFYFDFENRDSSYYVFFDTEFNRILRKYECAKTRIPLMSKSKLSHIEDCPGCKIYKFESIYREECYTWFVSDSLGFLKRYAPYHSDNNDYEISFLKGTPKSDYSLKLIKAIKADSSFHTRCSPGALW